MRTLRWAAELAVSNDARKSRLGVQELHALRKSDLLSSVEEDFVDAALEVTIKPARQAIIDSGEEAEVIFELDPNAGGKTFVLSEEGEQRGEASV